LQRHALFASGAFEFQDEAAQIASHLCEAKPGMRVLDLAAGAGGKSLALAADMNNEGEIVACDVREGALAELASRAARAGVSIIRTCAGEPPEGAFDIVLVDAPCSGSGTWRRQPELKWRLTPQRLEEYGRTQDQLLEAAVSRVRAGGWLVYATCSVLPAENEDRIAQFLGNNPSFVVVPVRDSRQAVTPKQQASAFFVATPRRTSTDGFFAAILARSAE